MPIIIIMGKGYISARPGCHKCQWMFYSVKNFDVIFDFILSHSTNFNK